MFETLDFEPAGSVGGGRSAEPADGPISKGGILHGKYRVIDRLGRGGMGTVWRVEHLVLRQERALKMIARDLDGDAEARARFDREARLMAAVSAHPNIVTVHDAQVVNSGAYIEMEYIRGRDLARLLRPGVAMPLSWAFEVLETLCDALQYAHERGIVHRDLKPSNLMLADGPGSIREHLRIFDFGLAKALGVSDPAIRSVGFLGTPAYASPEQVAGGPITIATDIHAIGVIAYEFLTGYRPYEGRLRTLMSEIVSSNPALPSARNFEASIPPLLDRAVMRSLAKDPADRPLSAAELAQEFATGFAEWI